MCKFRMTLASLWLCFGFIQPEVHAQDVVLQINQGLLQYSSVSQTASSSGSSDVKQKTNSMQTMPSNLELVVGVGSYLIYAYPTAAGTAMQFGYNIKKNLELGVLIGINSEETDTPEAETKSQEVGLLATYTHAMTASALEFGAVLAVASASTTEADGSGGENKSESNSTRLGISAAYVYPIAGSLSYVGGVSYTLSQTELKSSSQDQDSSTISLNLISLRLDF